jgi:hypothetical protein
LQADDIGIGLRQHRSGQAAVGEVERGALGGRVLGHVGVARAVEPRLPAGAAQAQVLDVEGGDAHCSGGVRGGLAGW